MVVVFFPQQADETLNFEEQILEAAKSIAAATSALVKSASAAQRELVAQGKVGLISANAEDDGQWSQGLISAVSVSIQRKSPSGVFFVFFSKSKAEFHQETFEILLQARMVAAATSNLCEAANASVQGHASEEKLISSAKQVAASTAQLLVACKVKADQDSEAMRRLQVRPHPPQEGCGTRSVVCEARGFNSICCLLLLLLLLADCRERSEEGVGQPGASSSECSVQQSRR